MIIKYIDLSSGIIGYLHFTSAYLLILKYISEASLLITAPVMRISALYFPDLCWLSISGIV